MEVMIQKWGNSKGIRLTKSILDALSLRENDRLEIRAEADSIVLTPCRKSALEERLTAFYGKPIEEIERVETEEFNWGPPAGREVW